MATRRLLPNFTDDEVNEEHARIVKDYYGPDVDPRFKRKNLALINMNLQKRNKGFFEFGGSQPKSPVVREPSRSAPRPRAEPQQLPRQSSAPSSQPAQKKPGLLSRLLSNATKLAATTATTTAANAAANHASNKMNLTPEEHTKIMECRKILASKGRSTMSMRQVGGKYKYKTRRKGKKSKHNKKKRHNKATRKVHKKK